MKCHAGVEFPSGKPCPECGAKLGEVCWPGINQDLLDVNRLRAENANLRAALTQFVAACETAPPTSLMTEIGMACKVAKAALS
jgi:hypothetical protein